jgi:hypothetical protein
MEQLKETRAEPPLCRLLLLALSANAEAYRLGEPSVRLVRCVIPEAQLLPAGHWRVMVRVMPAAMVVARIQPAAMSA